MRAQRAQSLITVMSGGFFLSGELFSSYQTDLQALWLYPLTIVRVVEHVIVARHFGSILAVVWCPGPSPVATAR